MGSFLTFFIEFPIDMGGLVADVSDIGGGGWVVGQVGGGRSAVILRMRVFG